MPMSVTMKAVHDLAAKFDASLESSTGHFSHSIVVHHNDGTSYHFEWADAYCLTDPQFLSVAEKAAREIWKTYRQAIREAGEDEDVEYPDEDVISEHQIGWLLVFTEHHGFHVFHREELTSCRVYKVADMPRGLPVGDIN